MTKQRIEPGSRSIIVPITARGPSGSVECQALLDTSCAFCVLPTHIMESLGYDTTRPLRQKKVVGVATDSIPLFSIESLKGLGYTLENCLVGVYDLPEASLVEALLGLSFLRHFRFTLDLPGGFYSLRYSPYYGKRPSRIF